MSEIEEKKENNYIFNGSDNNSKIHNTIKSEHSINSDIFFPNENIRFNKKEEKNNKEEPKEKKEKTIEKKEENKEEEKEINNNKENIEKNIRNSEEKITEIQNLKDEKIPLKENTEEENPPTYTNLLLINPNQNETNPEIENYKKENLENQNLKLEKSKLLHKKLYSFSSTQTNETKSNVKISKWRKKISKYLDSTPILIIMSTLTIWALFASDICYAFLNRKVDESFNIIQCILLGLFSLEFILTCISKENYMFSFFFFLDFISTVSLIQDIDYVMDPIMGYAPIQDDKISKNGKRKSAQAAKAISKVSTASRATRVLRVIRIVRLIRMVKLYKNVLIAKEKKEIMKEEQKKKIREKLERDFEESSNSKINDNNIDKVNTGINNNINNNINSNGKNYGSGKIRNIKKFKIKQSINGTAESTGGLLMQTTSIIKKNTSRNKILNNNNNRDNNLNNNDNKNEIKEESDKNNDNKNNDDDDDDDEEDNIEKNVIKESKISQIITDSLTKKVIILILVLLVIFPLLNDDFWQSDSKIIYEFVAQLLSLHYTMFQTIGIKDNQINITKLYDKKYPAINITINGINYYINEQWNNYNFRYKEVSTVYSEDAMVRIVYSLRKETKLASILNICQTIFVCIALTLSSILFENDANKLVLQPLEIMIEIVDKVAKDPIGAKNIEELQEGIKAELDKVENQKMYKSFNNKSFKKSRTLTNIKTDNHKLNEEDENYEVTVIKSAIIKISALLAIGFGDAGGEIIQKNLSNNQDLNPRLKGKKKTAIFCFCDIRQFEKINLALEEKTILFINKIAEIVHSSVDKFKGSTNKNIGESFLSVWKFYNEIKINEGKINEKTIKKDNLLEIDPTNEKIGIIADCSVLSCLRIILKINKNLDILSYREDENILKKIPNFKVNMGFGLHMGYGIEGAVGSTYKIDASYLSPNVNIAARLETATRQFNLNILISGVLYNLLTQDMKNICRYVDKVTVKGSQLPLDLYTIDLNLNVSPQKESKILILSNKEKRFLYNEKKMELEALIEDYGSVTNIILEKQSYKELIKERNEDFLDSWNEGINCYKKGDWKNANMFFGTCLKIDPNDGPANVLINFIRSKNLQPPMNWNGVRELSSK